MKYLTSKEFLKAPAKIQWLYTMALAKQPVGSSIRENAIKEHPEYFPDELEHRRKYDLIPQQVHDDYWKEWESAKQAAEYLKINRSAINNCVNKKSKTSNNFIWKRK